SNRWSTVISIKRGNSKRASKVWLFK
ncbi:molybdopterin dinucleotide binding domain protein, partial [Vibrio parahaemolyticus VP2007-007]